MGLLQIAGLVVAALWLVEVVAFAVSYRRYARVREARRRRVEARAVVRSEVTA